LDLSVPYKRTKLAAERLALERAEQGQDIVVVNPTTTIGERDWRPTPSGRMVRDVLTGRIRGYIASGGLNIVAAEDVARGHVLALERGRSGERYLLGGENVTMRQAFHTIARLGGVAPPRIALPYPPVFGAAKLVDLASRLIGAEPSLLMLDEVKLARAPMYFACRKAEIELGYEHRSAEEALTTAVRWFSQRLPRASRVSLAIRYGHS
jgi:dihydroflavonol-4-reductase